MAWKISSTMFICSMASSMHSSTPSDPQLSS
jgi:hypothetical protein